MLRFVMPLILCTFGTYFAFIHFWNGFDSITGDLGDARFNSYVLEHTWLWIKGEHILFNMPMFYPSPNAYAYSDFMLGFAPIYWFYRFIGCEILLSFQWWLITGSVLNFVSYYFLCKKFFELSTFWSSIAGFIFAFSLPRITHLEHAQMNAQFFIVLSAMGALWWWREPTNKKAPWLFCIGAVLQFISAFYLFWFWVWTLGVYAVLIARNVEWRKKARQWFAFVPRVSLIAPFLVSAVLVAPFLYEYAIMAKEFGRRDWVSVSNTIPRFYSWLSMPNDHWQWSFIPFKDWMSQLPMHVEHYLSFGLITWMGMIAAVVWIYRRKPEYKYLLFPVLAMFVFTITSGRFSTWVLVSYLFPGGGAIRAVGRIQIFMLMFWALIFVLLAKNLWEGRVSEGLKGRDRILAMIMVVFLLSESVYQSEWIFSRSIDNARLEKIQKTIPSSCELIVNPSGFGPNADLLNIDMVMMAFKTSRITMNGYSGHEPKNYRDANRLTKWSGMPEIDGKKLCLIEN